MSTQKLKINNKYQRLLNDDYDCRYVCVSGGRGSGKSFSSAIYAGLRVRNPGTRILFTRYTLTSAADSIIPEFTEKLAKLQLDSEFRSTAQSVEHISETGTIDSDILFRGIKTSSGNQTAKLKSLNGVNIWIMEEADELDDPDIFDTIDLSIRDTRRNNVILLVFNPPHTAHWLYSRFYKGIEPGFNGVVGNTAYIHTTYLDNILNLAPDYLNLAVTEKEKNEDKYNRIWLGHWADHLEHALFSFADIEGRRVSPTYRLPDMARVVVAVDPATTNTDTSDETGIVCAGLGIDGHFYILSDKSCRETPVAWATIAISEYESRKADRIVGETNQGGDMVEATIRSVSKNVSFDKVHASRGKIPRAEPVSALFSQGLVHVVGNMPKLESEMITYSGPGQVSPSRMDAMVWAISYLMQGQGLADFATLSQNKNPGTRNIDLSPSDRRLLESTVDFY
jgi:PBSX family phage terminase large subunit